MWVPSMPGGPVQVFAKQLDSNILYTIIRSSLKNKRNKNSFIKLQQVQMMARKRFRPPVYIGLKFVNIKIQYEFAIK